MFDARPLQGRLNARGYALAVDGDPGPKTFAALFAFVGRAKVTPPIVELGAAAARWFPDAGLTSSIRIAHALAQWAVETGGFSRFEENLSYSAERLIAVWPSRFPNRRTADPFAGNPVALANKVYGGRCGNKAAGDGWLFRGRGPTMLTFRDNYAEAARLTGLDVVADPDSVSEADTGLRVACAYWTARKINVSADRDDAEDVRYLVNGGKIGIVEAKAYLARAKQVLA